MAGGAERQELSHELEGVRGKGTGSTAVGEELLAQTKTIG
jgi:hypothetical protein